MHFIPKEISPERALFWGDNLLIMEQLLNEGYKGKFDLIYFDGPFNSGRIFSMPSDKLKTNLINAWDEFRGMQHFLDSELFQQDYLKRIRLAKELLSETGLFVFQIYQKEGHYLKVMLDQVFGKDHFLAEIIWKINDQPLPYNSQFGLSHECLFVYSRTNHYFKKDDMFLSSVWDDVGIYETLGDEDTLYPSQKPEKLMERIIEMTTEEKALVGDFYCGSGSFVAVAEKLNRRWMASDSSQHAIHVTKNRLAKLGTTINVHNLVECFDKSLVQGDSYSKHTNIPFSLIELEGLIEEMRDQVKIVNAILFSNDIDLIPDNRIIFNHIMPLINEDGISESKLKLVRRPKLVVGSNGVELEIYSPHEWILYNIQHIELDHKKYSFDWPLLQERVQKTKSLIGDQWISDMEQHHGHLIIKDVFGHYYTTTSTSIL